MPESNALMGWAETLPFSGGAMSSVLFYGAIRYGPKLPFLLGKLSGKVIRWTARGVSKIIDYLDMEMIYTKILKFYDKFKNNKMIRKILNRFRASSTATTVADTLEDRFKARYYPRKFKNLIKRIKRSIVDDGLDDVEALAKARVIEAKFDRKSGKWVPVLAEIPGQPGPKLIVKPKYRKFIRRFIEMTDDPEIRSLMEDTFYIPSKYRWLEKFKMEKWYPFKNAISQWWRTNWFKRNVINRLRKFYEKMKGGWNKWVNNKNYLGPEDLPQKNGVYAKYVFINFNEVKDDIREQIRRNFDWFKGPLEEVTGKTFKTVDDISDRDLLKFIVRSRDYINTRSFSQFMLRDADAVITEAYESMGNFIKRQAERVKENPAAFSDFRRLFWKRWKTLDDTEKKIWILRLMDGHNNPGLLTPSHAKIIYEDARAYLLKEGLLSRKRWEDAVTGEFLGYFFAHHADKVKGKMYSGILRRVEFKSYDEFKNAIPSFYLAPILRDTNFEDLRRGISIVWPKGKRIFFYDMPRSGQWPAAPWNPIGHNALQNSLRRASSIREGGCARQSICKIERGAPAGATETATAYLLDRRVPQSISVRLWRPKPDLLSRKPIWISTSFFYAGVPENPRFHIAGPCFAMAKVWKNGDTVYVKIDKTKKCDVGDCPSGIDTPNYCYADEEYIWGENLGPEGDNPPEYIYFAGFGACTAACTVALQGAGWKACLKGCAYATIGALFAHSLLETQRYGGISSWKRQEVGWGYWNYQKAGDICDILDTIASFGGGKVKTLSRSRFLRGIKKIWDSKPVTRVGKVFGPGDVCFGLVLMGDLSLSWPIKTPLGSLLSKGTPLNEACMQQSAAKCAWVEKT
jgi:hypothetical protein